MSASVCTVWMRPCRFVRSMHYWGFSLKVHLAQWETPNLCILYAKTVNPISRYMGDIVSFSKCSIYPIEFMWILKCASPTIVRVSHVVFSSFSTWNPPDVLLVSIFCLVFLLTAIDHLRHNTALGHWARKEFWMYANRKRSLCRAFNNDRPMSARVFAEGILRLCDSHGAK